MSVLVVKEKRVVQFLTVVEFHDLALSLLLFEIAATAFAVNYSFTSVFVRFRF